VTPRPSRKERRAAARAAAKHILPTPSGPRAPATPARAAPDMKQLYANSLMALGSIPPAVQVVEKNYLDGLRADSLLDGLVGTNVGWTGGGWTNCITGLGDFNRDKVLQGSFQESYRISDQELSALYNGNDLAKRIVDTVPREMLRRGWCLVVRQEDEDPDAGDAPASADGKTALEQPDGGESGPAAPGSPLVDPMGGPPDNASARVPSAVDPNTTESDPAKDATNGSASPDADRDPTQAKAQSDQQKKPGPGEPPGPAPSTDPQKQNNNSRAPDAAAPAPGAGHDDPMGEELSKSPQQKLSPGEDNRSGMTAQSDRKPAPGAPGAPIAPDDGGQEAAGDKGAADKGPGDETDNQQKGADLALKAEEYAARLQLKARVLESMIFGRLYGGGILIMGADDGQDMAQPLNEANIRTVRYLAWVDRRFVFANTWYAEIGPKYGEVETWQIVNPFGGQSNTIVHESRVVRFDGEPVDFLMRRRLLGWTLSVLQAPYDTLRQFDQSFQSISNLMSDMSQAVMKINGLAQLISNDQVTLNTRMQMVDVSRSSGRMLYIDAENEEFERTATPVSGVADIIQMQMLRTAAAAKQPVALLFGREPSGLNATGDADFRRFYDVTAGEQKTDAEPKLNRLYTVIFAAKDGPTGGKVPKSIEFVWHKLYEPSEKEQAEIRYTMAQADALYVEKEIVLPEEIALSRFRNGDLHLDTEIDMGLRHESLASAELAPSGAAKSEQEAQQAIDLAKATPAGAAGKGPPGAKGAPPGKSAAGKGPPGKGAVKPPPARGDTDDAARTLETFISTRTDAKEAGAVYEQLKPDYRAADLGWILAGQWTKKIVSLDQIDFSNRKKWRASHDGTLQSYVDHRRKVGGDAVKPVILVKPAGSDKYVIVDGHHRVLAAESEGEAVVAYVAAVQVARGPWDTLHDAQNKNASHNASYT
jgi:uncharacterized protein